jgi:predicted XRE-type DNA-binding protein
MFASEKLNEMGRSGGLNSINLDLKKTLTTKSGKFSGESYSKMHSAIVEDLESLSDKVSKQLELNFGVLSKDPASYGKFLSELPDLVSSPNGTNRSLSADLFSDVRTKFNDNYLKLNEQKTTVENELRSAGVPADSATRLLGNAASTNFDNEVYSIENGLKNKCFADTLADIDKDKLMNKIYDPSASKFANKFSSNFLKDKLNKILDNKDSSLDKKLSELKALESQTGDRYFLKMENSYEVQDVDDNGNLKQPEVISASNVRSPSVFFSDLIRNCNAQFKANKLSNKMSGASAIQKLRQLNQDYKNLAKAQAADMKKEVRKKLIECNSPEEANNTVAGSCTSDRFNTSSPGFCANAALSCSKNMQACTQQAEGYVKEIKEQRTARVNNYKALVEKNKMDVIKMFDSALSTYMKDGEALRGMFGAGFSSPAGIQREVDEGQKYLGAFAQATSRSPDGKLLLEDPAAHMDMFKKNIALLKESVRKQQDQILGGDTTGQGSRTPGLLGQHIQKTKKNYEDVAREADQIARQCGDMHDNAVRAAEQQRMKQQEDYQKKMTELGEKREEFCNMYGMVRENPQAMCGEVQATFAKDSLKAVSTIPGDRTAARQNVADLSRYCSQVGNYDEKKNSSPVPANQLCMDAQASTPRYLTDSDLKTKIDAKCKERENYKAGKCTASASSSADKISNNCEVSYTQTTKEIEDIYAYQRNTAPLPGSIKLDEAPAYCSAGYDSSNRFAKSVQDIGNVFADLKTQATAK